MVQMRRHSVELSRVSPPSQTAAVGRGRAARKTRQRKRGATTVVTLRAGGPLGLRLHKTAKRMVGKCFMPSERATKGWWEEAE